MWEQLVHLYFIDMHKERLIAPNCVNTKVPKWHHTEKIEKTPWAWTAINSNGNRVWFCMYWNTCALWWVGILLLAGLWLSHSRHLSSWLLSVEPGEQSDSWRWIIHKKLCWPALLPFLFSRPSHPAAFSLLLFFSPSHSIFSPPASYTTHLYVTLSPRPSQLEKAKHNLFILSVCTDTYTSTVGRQV